MEDGSSDKAIAKIKRCSFFASQCIIYSGYDFCLVILVNMHRLILTSYTSCRTKFHKFSNALNCTNFTRLVTFVFIS